MTWVELVKEYFPAVSDEEADYILWEKTGFPTFWLIPENGNTVEECCGKRLQELKDTSVGEKQLAGGSK